MPSSTSSNPNPHSNPKQLAVTSQHPIQAQFSPTTSILRLFQSPLLTILLVTMAVVIALVGHQNTADRHEQLATGVTANDIPQLPGTPHHDSLNPTSIQTEDCNPFSNTAQATTVPMAKQFEGAEGFSISGNPWFANIGINTGSLSAVYNYGRTYGLENLKDFISFAALYNSAEQDHGRRCHPGTREHVLKQLQHWIDNPNPSDRIFWLHGPAGAGKSAIAQTIAHTYKLGEVAATFFFFRSDPSRNDGNRLFPTIAWQLAFSIPAIKDFIIHALDKIPHLPRTNIETQFEELVANPAKNIASQMPHPAPVVIIDGVDECFDEHLQQRFLTIIGDAVKDPRVPLRFLICSRPEALIEETLDQFKGSTVSIDLATLDDSDRDIQKYLVDQFSAIAFKEGLHPTWPGQEIIEEIVLGSSGNFILPSTLIRFIGDEDYSPESQLDIVRKLKPHGKISPFALLDKLYLEILKRPPDQDFLKTFLALLIGRSSIEQDDLHEDDATLMNISKKDLHTKLRKTRSLLRFEPFIDVYHKSFLDFLQDSSRSGQYHVNKQAGLKRYLELVVDSVVQHVSTAIEQPDRHETCRFSPKFKYIVKDYHYPPKIVLPGDDWQSALKPLQDLQDKLLNTSKPRSCRVTQVMRDLLLYLVLLERKSDHIAATHVPESNMNERVTGWISAPMTEATQNILETDLDSCLSALLSCLQKTNSIMEVDEAIVGHMASLLTFDYVETATRVRSVSDAQKLIDLIVLLKNESFHNQCGPDAARKAVHLASKIFARVPVIPLSPFLNKPARHFDNLGVTLEFICQNIFIGEILDHNYILPVLNVYNKVNELRGGFGNVNEQIEPVHQWLKRASPNFSTRIRVMLEIARSIRYIHSMDIALYSPLMILELFFLDSNLRAKSMFWGLFAWWSMEASIYNHEDKHLLAECTYEANMAAFANLFYKVCFDGHNDNTSNRLVGDARRLIEQCRAEEPESRPTMEDVVKEMETWKLT